ncbi:phenol hydroxylase subunit [Mangrovitalea sediminis]|uniref:phenol hydroxylase subunit n=1 Tax=Mangrovitalea sediminis TaxID=1982043 RepID=UPI000BE6102E|nr:phenol hydroxylase subunit [Mangrovitalea sediminis]
MNRLTDRQPYVRVTDRRPDGFVEFDFSYGDSDLYVELILPVQAFSEFCANNQVAYLSDNDAAALDADRRKWREGGLN